jgi:hypothetical protein
MDRPIWKSICAAIRSADRRVRRCGRRRRFSDQQIVKMLIWSIQHDRPLCWACDRAHYNTLYRPRQLPSVSQFCRRVKTPRVNAMLRGVHEYLVRSEAPASRLFFDGKPLPIGDFSRDPDARDGFGVSKLQRGYKVHALGTQDGRILDFRVLPLNAGEPDTARQLTPSLPPRALVLADSNYDSSLLYQAVSERHCVLLTPLKGRARSAGRLQQMAQARRWAIDFWDNFPQVAQCVQGWRDQIERIFSAMCSYGGGLSPLPAWVRRLDRVRRWVTAKIIVYHARLSCRTACG